MGLVQLSFVSLFLFLAIYALVVYGNVELRALMELKSSLDPENKFLSSWSSVGDPCSGSFEGVACNEHRKVANISLQGKGLSGQLSPAVAQLQCLSGLYLHFNNLSGEIPREIGNLSELSDLYLNVNNLSGSIPPEVGKMVSLQVLQLCCNQLNGSIPTEMGWSKRLTVLALQHNQMTGKIPVSLGNLKMLRRLDLSFNNFFGQIPEILAGIASLEFLDVRNNSLTGIVPTALKGLKEGFSSEDNLGLCGTGFPALRPCNTFDDNRNTNQLEPSGSFFNHTASEDFPVSADLGLHCNKTHCAKSRKFPHAATLAVVAGIITITIILITAAFFIFFRRRKQKITSTLDPSEGRLSTDQAKEFYRRSPSPLAGLEYTNGWGPLCDGQSGNRLSHESLNHYRFNIDEVESATQYFSEANLLRKSKFSAVYKGVLRDGSAVAIRSISVTCCKSEEAEFMKGLNLLTLLKHENLIRLRGFCCSRGRGECFLIYDHAPNGNLSQYLDVEDGSNHVLNWSKRFSIINGIAKGLRYLHSNEANKPTIVHQNVSVEKVLLGQQFNPLIMNSALPKLLADDVVFSALKVSAAMGYLAPEYITTGRFTEKSDIYAFGVIVLQVLCGRRTLGSSMRLAVESLRYEDFVDTNLEGNYSKSEAAKLAKIATMCTHELPDQRPTMEEVVLELSNLYPDS